MSEGHSLPSIGGFMRLVVPVSYLESVHSPISEEKPWPFGSINVAVLANAEPPSIRFNGVTIAYLRFNDGSFWKIDIGFVGGNRP